jgi:hypothetical protein
MFRTSQCASSGGLYCTCTIWCITPYWIPCTILFEGQLLIVIGHTQTHTHTAGRTPLNQWSALRKGRYLHNKHKRHAFDGIRTSDSSNRVTADLPRRPRGHHDLPTQATSHPKMSHKGTPWLATKRCAVRNSAETYSYIVRAFTYFLQ